MTAPLYLASTSRYRAGLLARLGIPFQVEAPGVDEARQAGESAASRAARLARAKAAAVAARHPGAWVLGSDQVAAVDGQLLGKPGDAARCREQLRAASGKAVEFHTGVALARVAPHSDRTHVDLTVVRFRPLDDAAIARYVALDQPYDCAGGFRSEGLGAALCESVETRDPSALVGLPLLWVARALRDAGLDPLAPARS
jgi:7-methyl-GTP pyrophosphatase